MNLYDYLMSMNDNEIYTVYDSNKEVVVHGKVDDIIREVPRQFLETFKVKKFRAYGAYYVIMVV